MIPVLYSENETSYLSNGIGRLADCISARATENSTTGDYTLDIRYPTNGVLSDALKYNRTIKCLANNSDAPQLFDIHDISDNADGTIDIYARHIKHRLFGVPVGNFSAAGLANALSGLATNALLPIGFTLYTDMTSTANFALDCPTDIGHALRGSEGSILDVYGGEFHYDNFIVSLLERRGADYGAEARYGINLKRLSTDIEGVVYTGVYAYWKKEVNGTVQLVKMDAPLFVQYYDGKQFVQILDFSDKYENAPTVAQLTTRARKYLGTGQPDISYEVDIETSEYDQIAIGDTIRVIDPPMDIDIKARVYETEYDPLLERMTSLKVGAFRPTIYDMLIKG